MCVAQAAIVKFVLTCSITLQLLPLQPAHAPGAPELAQAHLVPVPLAPQRRQHVGAPELGVGVALLLHAVRERVLGGRQRHCRGQQ